MNPDPLTLAKAALIMREAVRDKSYLETSLGSEVAGYLRHKRKTLVPSSYEDWESTLSKLCWYCHGLELADFEPPVGSQRVEDFLEAHWGSSKPRTYNKHLTITRTFFRYCATRGLIQGDPTLIIERAKVRGTYRTTFTSDQRCSIIAESPERRDRIALRLLLDYGIRKGSLQSIRFQHFDHIRKRLTIFAKGGKIRNVPIPDPAFWHDLERHILDIGAQPDHYLLPRIKGNQERRWSIPDQPMGGHGLHLWWYRALERAGIVASGTTSGERLHKARHTAGQRLLDATGNLKAVQQLLGHESITTTADVYVDWDEDALAASLESALRKEEEG